MTLVALDRHAARPRRRRVAAGGLDPVAGLGAVQHVAEDQRGGDEPEERDVDAERPDAEVADERSRRASGPAAFQVRCGKPSVMKSAVPRTTSSMPRVTRNEGIFSRVTKRPLKRPIAGRDQHGDEEGRRQRHDAGVEERPHQHRREAEDRADREVELARRHQERHRERDQAELDGEGEGVADVERRQERRVDRREDDELDDEQHQRPELGHQRRSAGGRDWFPWGAVRPARRGRAGPRPVTCRRGCRRRAAPRPSRRARR